MQGERGAASMLGMVLTMVILVLAAWFFMKNTGFLGGGGEDGEQTPIDQAETVSVLMELRTVKQGMELYRISSTDRAYPGASEIRSLENLQEVLPDVFPLPEELSFDFISYARLSEDEYVMKVRAHDTMRTLYEVGSGFGPRKVNP
ncbi:hypothetical protein ACFL6T_03445 [Candidatus Zixiibacteriota bacterium]